MIGIGIRLIQVTYLAAGLSAISASALADAGHSHGPAIGKPAKASDATRTVQVRMGDNFYEPSTIQVKSGETVRFILNNTGERLHEFNIGTAAMHAEHRKEMLAMQQSGVLTATRVNPDMSKMDHSKMGHGGHSMKHDDPNSVLVEPGETKELVWTFTRAADLEFACNVPGHYEDGMFGYIEFER